MLFREVRRQAEKRRRGDIVKASIAPHGSRHNKPAIESLYLKALGSLDSTPYPDPPFFPEGAGRRVMLSTGVIERGHTGSDGPHGDYCLVFDTRGGRQPYELPMATKCAAAVRQKNERAVWLWHVLQGVNNASAGPMDAVGYFRPSFTRTSNVFCLGAVESKGQGALRFQECNDSERQQWVLMRDPKSDARAVTPWWYGLRNVALKTCVRLLAPTSDTEPVRVGLDDCASVHGSRNTSAMRWRLDPPRYVGANAAILPNMIA
eukprot:m.226141 g.226141  ORF g.226141 m.226141 type:complete len:262 (+) comp36028_c0_seq1:3-788(+)